ncbi:MAG: NUDIX hydrolase [uncultured bacterium]|nr:MAG: NUDIX hydrolase [uncultured bacterium]
MEKWKIIKETDVSPSKWFPVLQQTVELPNGKIVDDYFISPMGNVVMVLPITSKNEIVLVKQYKHAIGEILIELPAGFQQKGKTLEESALAELEEEVGIKTTIENLISIGKNANNPTKTTHVTYCYLAKNLEFNSRQDLDETEEIEIIKVSPQEALEMIKNGEIWVADSVAAITRTFLLYPELFKV